MVWKSGLTLQKCKKYLVFQEYREIIPLSLAKKNVLTWLRWFSALLFSWYILVFTKAPTLTSLGTEILYLATKHVHHGQRHCKLPPLLHHFHHNISCFSRSCPLAVVTLPWHQEQLFYKTGSLDYTSLGKVITFCSPIRSFKCNLSVLMSKIYCRKINRKNIVIF